MRIPTARWRMRESGGDPALLSERYRLLREIGRGGAGRVFVARDEQLGGDVAVKFLERPADPGSIERFVAEIRTVASLTHPHILPVFDSGVHDGAPFYVMPWVRGESLKQHLGRVGRLPVKRAVAIARQAAAGLAYAHAHGVVHRDVKPANLLLGEGDHVYIADFGVAWALERAGATGGEAPAGTPGYMSPEQIRGGEVDGRSDIYGLGCVLFHMLAGRPPFRGRIPAAVLRAHLLDPVPSLRSIRADVPAELEEVVGAALAREPDRRPASAASFGRALEAVERTLDAPAAGWSARRVVLTAAAAAGVVWGAVRVADGRTGAAGDGSLRLRVAVVDAATGPPDAAEELRRAVTAALRSWEDLDVVDAREGPLEGPIASGGTERLPAADEYVEVAAEAFGDSVRAALTLRRASDPRVAAGRSVRWFPSGLPPPDSLVRVMTAEVLDPGLPGAADAVGPGGTRLLAARRAYGRALQALRAWNLIAADSALTSALAMDGTFALAHLRLAQARNFAGLGADAWRTQAERAAARADDFGVRDAYLARGLLHLARAEWPEACAVYDAMEAEDPADFAVWYGRGECRDRDDRVEPDAASPTGWRFRGGYQEALRAYEQAFTAVPESHRAFRSGGFRRLQQILRVRGDRPRLGRGGSPHELVFAGWPAWMGDSIAVVPYPWHPETGAFAGPPADAQQRGLLELRRTFARITSRWATAFPDSPDALYAVALGLEMHGDAAAVDSLVRAERMATDERLRRHLSAARVWVLVKQGLPDRPDLLERARVLADTLLGGSIPSDPEGIRDLEALAALTGRPSYAGELAAQGTAARSTVVDLPAGLLRTVARLTALAAAGGDPGAQARLERDVWRGIDEVTAAEDRATARLVLLEQASILAFPGRAPLLLDSVAALQSPAGRAQKAWRAGDTAQVRAILDGVRKGRAGLPPSELTLDALLAEARLLALVGDTAAAAAWIGPTLESVRWMQPGALRESGVRAGVLVPAITLYTELLEAEHRMEEARRWAAAGRILWQGAAAEVRPLVRRLEELEMRAAEPPVTWQEGGERS